MMKLVVLINRWRFEGAGVGKESSSRDNIREREIEIVCMYYVCVASYRNHKKKKSRRTMKAKRES